MRKYLLSFTYNEQQDASGKTRHGSHVIEAENIKEAEARLQAIYSYRLHDLCITYVYRE